MKVNGKSNPIAGVFVGLLFVIGGLILLWWNEGRTVKTEASIKEAEQNYIDVSSDKVDSANEGKIIATNGEQKREKNLEDEIFGVIVDSSKLKRVVEVYQWVENCTEDNNGNESCEYDKNWKDDIVDSSKFKESVDHSNPKTMKYDNKTYMATNVKIGEFNVPESLLKDISTKGKVQLSTANDDQRYAATQLNLKIDDSGRYFTDSANLSSPEVGDMRVSFEYNDEKYVSMMGVQKGNTIDPYVAKSGYKIYHLYEGQHNGAQMIQMMRDTNRMIKIICRVGGIILVIIGLLAIISPIQKVASYVPVLGSIFNGVTSFIAILLGLAISIIDIAIAWIAYRPVLGIGLLVAAVALIILSIVLKKKKPAPVEQPTTNN